MYSASSSAMSDGASGGFHGGATTRTDNESTDYSRRMLEGTRIKLVQINICNFSIVKILLNSNSFKYIASNLVVVCPSVFRKCSDLCSTLEFEIW